MTIYLLTCEPEGFKELTLPTGESLVKHDCARWSGESKLSNWSIPQLEWMEDDFTQSDDLDADFLKFSGTLVVTDSVRQLLEQELAGLVEFLPIKIEKEVRYIINVLNVLDVMDKQRSRYKIYSDGNIGMAEHAFINEPEKENKIYKVRGFLGRTFISHDFCEFLKQRGFTGLLVREYKNP